MLTIYSEIRDEYSVDMSVDYETKDQAVSFYMDKYTGPNSGNVTTDQSQRNNDNTYEWKEYKML